MKIIKPHTRLLEVHGSSQTEVLRRIERCGRVCYKSEDKITEDSCVKFAENIIKRGHEAVLEHASVILLLSARAWTTLRSQIADMESSAGFRSFLRFTYDDRPIVSGNIRAWRDFAACSIRQYGTLPAFMRTVVTAYPVLFPEYDIDQIREAPSLYKDAILTPDRLVTVNELRTHLDRTVIFTCDRGISHEIVRHRPASYCQESTRYCNYSKEGFGGEITVIAPCYLEVNTEVWRSWYLATTYAEYRYFELLDLGCTPQEARAVLPNSLKTEVCMTASLSEWTHFLRLRGSKAAHPQIRELALPLSADFRLEHCSVFGDVYNELRED